MDILVRRRRPTDYSFPVAPQCTQRHYSVSRAHKSIEKIQRTTRQSSQCFIDICSALTKWAYRNDY